MGLVEGGEKVGIDVVLGVGEEGLSIPDDLNAIKDAQAFFVYFKSTFLTGVEKIYDDIRTASGEETPCNLQEKWGGSGGG